MSAVDTSPLVSAERLVPSLAHEQGHWLRPRPLAASSAMLDGAQQPGRMAFCGRTQVDGERRHGQVRPVAVVHVLPQRAAL